MARTLGVSWPTLREWCDTLPRFEASGAFVAGGNGVEYQFRAKRALDFLLKHFRGKVAKQAAASQRLHRTTDVVVGDDEDYSFAETGKLIDYGGKLQRAKFEAGDLVVRSDVETLFNALNDLVRTQVMSNSRKIDPNGNLDAKLRARFEDWSRETLVQIHLGALEIYEAFNAGTRSKGIGRAS